MYGVRLVDRVSTDVLCGRLSVVAKIWMQGFGTIWLEKRGCISLQLY